MVEPGHRSSVARPIGLGVVLVVALAAATAIVVALWQLTGATQGLEVVHTRSGHVPLTVYRPRQAEAAPAVVIAHGFAGSQRLMRSYAVTLARNGYVAVTFDFAGHGRNASPFVSRLLDVEGRRRILLKELERAVDLALAQPGADGRLALVGHSMAGDVLAHYAAAHPQRVSATVLLSPYLSDEAKIDELRDLLLLYGALEPEMLHRQGLEVLGVAIESEPRPGETYGDWASGGARRLELVPGVEHIGVLFAVEGLATSLDWLNHAFGRSSGGFIARSGPWLGLLYLGLVGLAWPLSRYLPVVSAPPAGAGLGWRRLLPVALMPAILTPLILWKLPTDFLPVLIGDYLALHFAVYGLLTWAGLWLSRSGGDSAAPDARRIGLAWRPFLVAVVMAAAYFTLALGGATDRFVTTLFPGPERIWVVAALLVGTLSFFTADEWLTRGERAARGGYAATKLLFLLSLSLAVALNLNELFFLIIITPAILVFFTVFGLMSGWIYRRAGQPLVGAVANAVAFSSAIAATFPLVGG